MRRTFIEDFYEGTHCCAYPVGLARLAGSLAGKVWGVVVVLDIYPDYLHLVRLCTPRNATGNGYGSKALRKLCGWADKHKLEIHLQAIANDHAALNNEQLIAWYERNGFKKIGQWLIRKPVSKQKRTR